MVVGMRKATEEIAFGVTCEKSVAKNHVIS